MTEISKILIEIYNTFFAMAPYLLMGLAFAGILHVLFTKSFILKHMGGNNIASVIKASLLGVPLPLCSCGVLPTAISLRKNNASEGATMSFLISTPQTGIDSMIATYGMLGPVFAIFRPVAAFFMGIGGGLLMNLFGGSRGSKAVMPGSGVMECPLCYVKTPHRHGLLEKLKGMFKYAFGDFLDDISLHLIIGIVISGLISYFLPPNFFSRYAGNTFIEMLIMIAGGIPLYVCATASIPIAMAMMMKGLSPGAAFVFLAVGPATNAAALILISKTMGKRFLSVFLGSIAVFSMISGYALNFVFEKTGSQISHAHMMHEHAGHSFNWWVMSFSLIFLVMLVLSLYRKYGIRLGYRMLVFLKAGKPETDIRCVLSVEGMTCKNCALKVSNALYAVGGVRKVEVDLKTKQVKVTGHGNNREMKDAVRKTGYIVLDE
jgi:uncharacterized membrane protein YraQ (UPF0718 family)/copper chaperone CopZ